MINFYGGQKGENYVVSQIFANREELKKDLVLDENSPIGLNEIVMICYGEYSNDENSEYRQNLNIDNPSETDIENENNSFEYKMNYNSSLYQKVPNGNWIESDVFAEDVEFGENGKIDRKKYAPINLYKYRFLTSSMGEIPKITLQTGTAVAAWETPEVIENEQSQLANPIFDLHMPKAPTIIGSNGGEGKDVGILINPDAKGQEDTDINPYQVIKFDIIEQETTEKKDTIQDTYKNVTKDGITYVDYKSVKQSLFGVDYENTGDFQQIKDIRGPAGLPGRIPQVINGNWYNWTVDSNNSTNLILTNSGISASFVVYAIESYDSSDTNLFPAAPSEEIFINQIVNIIKNKYENTETGIKYNNQIIVVNGNYNGKKFTIACFRKEAGEWGWSYFVANASNFLIESGTGTNSIQQYNTEAKALGEGSVAFNSNTLASGITATAYGTETVAGGENAFAEGSCTEANAKNTHTEGNGTIAASENQHVQGKYNIEDASNKYAHIVGNGSSAAARSNAYTLDWDGNSWFQGSVISRTYSIILSANDWQESQDEDNVNKYTQQIVLNDFDSHDKDWSVIVNPAYTNNMTKLELQNYQREYNRLSSGYVITKTEQGKETINFTVFDRPPQGDLTIIIKVV